ncbi:MAG: HAMP domain-containing protein [Bauldia sp.]|nr:HAMP domain-containing protein [Bauldia sp.]
MRLLPRTLGGQLTALLLLALAASQIVAFSILSSERALALREADRAGLIENAASVLRVLRLAAPENRAALAAAASSPRVRLWITDASVVTTPATNFPTNSQFTRVLGQLPEPARFQVVRDAQPATPVTQVVPAQPTREAVPGNDAGVGATPGVQVRGETVAVEALRNAVRPTAATGAALDQFMPFRTGAYDILLSVPFADGGWLNAQTAIRTEPITWAWASTISTAAMALAILAIVAFTARRATKPLRALATRADSLGRGTPEPPLPEGGPDEVRRVTVAFNRMQERLSRFVTDRTRMLAAIGHDLRTPITSLRLRTELLDDDDNKTKMLATLEEMQRMIEATLAFARDEAGAETPRAVDLSALLSTIVDDHADAGQDVVFADASRLVYPCRPVALRRAVANLIANAVQYGERARVTLEDGAHGPIIAVEDDGPGIPAGQMEDVFQPFVRLESSRSRGTGGVGLGLSIARSIVLAHGGELTLANLPGGGLRAEIRLPRTDGHVRTD